MDGHTTSSPPPVLFAVTLVHCTRRTAVRERRTFGKSAQMAMASRDLCTTFCLYPPMRQWILSSIACSLTLRLLMIL